VGARDRPFLDEWKSGARCCKLEVVSDSRAIGVFDSGVGGLTVLRALRAALPHESLLYLGDTARVPYGTKSRESVTRYALQAARALVARDVKALVVACNTASAVALDVLAGHLAVPVIGVVRPGAEAACRASESGRIAVIGTESTVRGGAYQEAIRELRPSAQVVAQACSLFVALAEEGWLDGEVVQAVARRYLTPLFDVHPAERPDCLVLGCTHFPVLAPVLAEAAGPGVKLVDSAATTAVTVATRIASDGLARMNGSGDVRFLATDGRERFRSVGERFLGASIGANAVELIDL
jgi:glutamate racemase